ncbi:MAG: TonB-dependent receptor [Bacteroidales bacterium]|jgi:TonB-linked SusC/RagA family outer membrane protein|nr:TonB-dependent receptor [Bacteroidota bacterium]NLO00053.1 TonB-dependent receptor [Bacteroidales bacterium]
MKMLLKFKWFAIIAVCLLAGSVVSAQDRNQQITVSGTVTDARGEPLVGAMVLVKGTQIGSAVDPQGRYSIRTDASATLVASLMGYKAVEEPVRGRSSIDFQMQEDVETLEEAVAIGYGTQSKLTLTGSVAQTSGRELTKSSSVNLSQGLAGRLSGVIVNNRSGEPGRDDAIMFIRGRSTLGENKPLIIIDGVPGRGDEFSRLTGDEIESINVLKDASAAIYGARSANGVILVTTKRGKYNDAPTVTFSYDLGLQQPTRLVSMADAVLFTKAYNAELAITGASPYYNETQIQHYIDQDDPILYPNTNWFDQIIKPLSAQHKYGVSINGGSDKVAYFVQFNGQYQDGIYKMSATNYNQFSVRSNIDIQVTSRFKLGFDLSARRQHKNYSAFPSDSYGIFYIATRMKPTGAAYFPNGYLRGGTNPAVLVQDLTGYDRTTINTVTTTFSANWDLGAVTEGLSVNGKLAYDVVGNFRKNWQKNWQYWSFDEITELYEEHTVSYWSTPVLHEYQRNSHTLTVNANLNYDRTFGGHHVTALAGFEQSSYRLDYLHAGINRFDSDILDELFAGSADKSWYAINGYARETARRSFFGRLGYDFRSKYMIQGIIRFDGSENFPKGKRWGIFPGVSFGWRASEEPFLKDAMPWLTNLKFRASYGEQGNDQIDPFQYLTTYQYSSSIFYKQLFDGKEANFIIPGTLPNPNVTWEVAKTWNIGIDGSIDRGIFGWEFELFRTKRSNILCTRNASIPYYTGLTNNLPDENIGRVRNQGVELQLSHENRLSGGDLRYRLAGNFLYAKNTIEYMDETPWGEGHEYMNLTGHPMGAGLYYQVAGINKTQADLENIPQMSGATLGDFYFKDLDNDGKITNLDRKRCDLTSVPQIVFGLNAEAQWKNFDFSMLLQGQARVRYYYAPLTDPVSGNVERFAAERAWTLDNPDSDYPRIGSNIVNGSVTRSSWYYRNAAFLRLKNIELGYSIPSNSLFNRLGINGLRFYIAGYNLLTLSGLKEVDPETSDESYQTYPQVRIFNTGVKLTF